MLRFIRKQLEQPVDQRLCVLLYLMIGLLAYIIIDRGEIISVNKISSIREELQDIHEKIEMWNEMIGQIPRVRKEIETLKKEQAKINFEDEEWVNKVTFCNETKLLNIFKQNEENNSPFVQFRVQKGIALQSIDEYVYEVDLYGSYFHIIRLLGRLDDSACASHVTRWTMKVRGNNQDFIEGMLSLRLYKKQMKSAE